MYELVGVLTYIKLVDNIMIEFFKHLIGLCGDHWHPNVITLMAGSPVVLATVHYVKCKCGGWFKHKENCENK